jgi:exo-beta-1,3-glucanase (GH17 family)
MNALPILDLPKPARKSRRSSAFRQSPSSIHSTPVNIELSDTATTNASRGSDQQQQSISSRQVKQIKVNRVYAHRQQGLEVVTKLLTYTALSIVGGVTLVNLFSYNYAQHQKLQHLETELQDAKIRTQKVTNNLNRSFDPQAQKSVMQENTYKVAPDRLQIFLVDPATQPPAKISPSK